MKKLLILTCFVVVISSAYAAMVQVNKKIVGEWKYEVPSAPIGYEKGVIIILKKGNNLDGEIKFSDGSIAELKKVTFKDGILKCELYANYDLITITAKVDGKKMAGTVNTPGGDMPLHAKKVKRV